MPGNRWSAGSEQLGLVRGTSAAWVDVGLFVRPGTWVTLRSQNTGSVAEAERYCFLMRMKDDPPGPTPKSKHYAVRQDRYHP